MGHGVGAGPRYAVLTSLGQTSPAIVRPGGQRSASWGWGPASASTENAANQRIVGCHVLRHEWAVPGDPEWRATSGRTTMGKDEKQTEADRTRRPCAG
jgi:hypothetical protein